MSALPASSEALPAWLLMWLIAFVMFVLGKYLTWRSMLAAGQSVSPARTLAYLFAWPGMDARAFCREPAPLLPAGRVWRGPFANSVLGVLLIWFIPRLFVHVHPLVAGWSGMIGLVLLLHFGLFHLAALWWRRAGINAEPIMQAPLRSVSVAEFWGRRWNRAFHELIQEFLYRPLRRRLGTVGATLLGFLASGFVHEIVISLPACGGWGLPSCYFLLQGAAVLLERSAFGRRLGLGRGWRGRAFLWACVAVPAFALFHPPFVNNVILPMLKAFRAI